MKFVKTAPNAIARPIANALIDVLTTHNRVLWLVPGGSNIPVVAKIMSAIPESLHPRLAIMLTDERYGETDHPDSNIRQLAEAGFRAGGATVVPVLVPGLALKETVQRYEEVIEQSFEKADYILGYFGMGADGHIAGALPGSPAVASRKFVVGYDAGQFVRITLTIKAMRRLDAAVLAAFGDAKVTALTNLRDKKLPLREQPAQVLKSIKNVVIYNDQIKG